MPTGDGERLTMDQLRIGQYVYLDMKWMEHPFAFSRFKIKTQEQIDIIRSLGLASIRFNPALSDNPVPPPRQAQPMPSPQPEPDEPNPAVLAKREMMAKVRQRREQIEKVEASFVQTAQALRDIEKNLYARPAEAIRAASGLVTKIADSVLSAPELAIHVMSDTPGAEETYFHSLNVTMLAMMVARDLKLPIEVAGALGMGALMHDIGLRDVPSQVMMKTSPWTQAERHFYELHCQYGVSLGQRLHLAPAVLTVIREHHELFDGSGYPNHIRGEAMGLMTRIVSIANYYEELCHPQHPGESMMPSEALALMFAKLKDKFDPQLLQVFIRCLGVYPPGTVVQLSNGVIGMVSTINTVKPMKPAVVLYDADIPKEEAMMVDLEQLPEVSIARALRPAQLPAEVYAYLSPRQRVSYYFEATGMAAKKGRP